MKLKFIILLIFLLIIFNCKTAKSEPIISNPSIQPSDVWLGEDVLISIQCADTNETYNITRVYAVINGPNITVSNFELNKESEDYSRTLTRNYISRSGNYDVILACDSDNDESNSTSISFTVSQLETSIENINPNPAYIEDEIEIDVATKKNEIPINSDVNFTVYLNDEPVALKQDPPIFDSNKGWILLIDAPSSLGIFDVRVDVNYDRTENTVSSTIEIKQPLNFELVSIDKTWVQSNENATLTFKTLYRGNPITMRNEYLNINLGSTSVSITGISQSNEYSYVNIIAPSLSPGSYDMKIRFSYQGFVQEITKKISYVVPVSGSILNSENKPIYTQITFKNNDTEKTITTDSAGSYSGSIPPGTYTLSVFFPNAKLIFDSTMINSFDNPMKFDNPSTGVNIPGVGVGGVFVFETVLSYSNVYVEMKYDSNKILNEDDIIVYKCSNWNSGKKTCNTNWLSIITEVDRVRDLIKFNSTSLSAFVIGYKKVMYVDFNTDKKEYFLQNIIKITGIARDEDNGPIPDVDITAKILSTDITAKAKSDNSGVFSLELNGPDKEGSYTIFVEGKKSPFIAANNSANIKLVKSDKLSTLVPDSFDLKQGETKTMYISIVNEGQTDYSGINISLSGIPKNYYAISPAEISELKAGQQKDISIKFNVPEDAAKESLTGNFKIDYGENYIEEQFIFTILAKEERNETLNVTSKGFNFPSFSLPTGKIILPTVGNDVLIITIVALVSFSISFLLKGKKYNKKLERENVTNMLLDIRREVERFPKTKTSKINRKKLRKTRKTK